MWQWNQWLPDTNTPWFGTLFNIAILLGAALLVYGILRFAVMRAIGYVFAKMQWQFSDSLKKQHIFTRLITAIPFLIIQTGITMVPNISKNVSEVIANLAMGLAIFFVIRSIASVIALIQSLPPKPGTRQVPIKGYLELLRIALYTVGTIVVIAIMIGRSPLLLLSGLGALSAVLMLVFKDTILGFVASVQLSSNDMLRIGDWIEMPSAGADGDVIDISLHTVKVHNWDKTITTIPTWKLISESFKNWRGMFNTGGRRIKRSLFIDAASVRFLSEDEQNNLKRFRLLTNYLEQKKIEIEQWNESLGEMSQVPVNKRRLTNLGTFRAYAQAYLENHPGVHKELMIMVRHMPTAAEGIPLEIYCFTNVTAWKDYERIQADIFDHLYSIVSEFDLDIYQKPGGSDIRIFRENLTLTPSKKSSNHIEFQN